MKYKVNKTALTFEEKKESLFTMNIVATIKM